MAKQIKTFKVNENWTVPNDVCRVNVFLVGGGGGGACCGGGGGGGGRVAYYTNLAVTPGSLISVTIGGGGPEYTTGGTTSFGAIASVAGGAGTSSGVGGASSQNINGSTINRSGGNAGGGGGGGGGAGAGGNGSSGPAGAGGNGYAYTIDPNGNIATTVYGGGGGGAIGNFDQNTGRPLTGGQGGLGGGGGGGGENLNGTPGQNNYGGGGGGGAKSGISQTWATPGPFPTYATSRVSYPDRSGASGGSGIVIIDWEPATYVLEKSTAGVSEGGSLTITLRTTNVNNGTVFAYTMSGANVTAGDFSPATLTGNFTISSTDGGLTGTASVTLNLVSDSTLEDNEIVNLSLNTVGTTITFEIGDFSKPALTNVLDTKISASHYNNIRDKVVLVYGTSSTTNPTYGYGLTPRSSAVNLDSRVTVNDWANLRFDIINAWIHQYNTTPSLSTVSVGGTVIANRTTAPYAQYDSFADVLLANRYTVHASQSTSVNKGTKQTVWPGLYGLSWNGRIQCVVNVKWNSSAEARHFFNSGGEVRFTSTRTGGSSTTQNNSWSTLLSSAGTRAFGGQKPGVNTEPNNGQNFFRLNNVYQVWSTSTATSPYSSNTFKISAQSVGVADNSSGTASEINFLIEWTDDHVAPGAPASQDQVDGTLSLAVTTLEATGILQPAGSGNFVVPSPTVTIGEISP